MNTYSAPCCRQSIPTQPKKKNQQKKKVKTPLMKFYFFFFVCQFVHKVFGRLIEIFYKRNSNTRGRSNQQTHEFWIQSLLTFLISLHFKWINKKHKNKWTLCGLMYWIFSHFAGQFIHESCFQSTCINYMGCFLFHTTKNFNFSRYTSVHWTI